MKTVLVLVLAAVCATQIYSATTPDASANGLVGDVNTLLSQLLSTVQTAVQNALNTIQSLLAALTQFATSVVGDLRTDLNSTLTSLLDPLNNIIDKAAGLGVDITQCGLNQIDPVLDLPGNLVGGVEKCVNGILNKAEVLANNTIDSVTGTLGQVTDLGNDLLSCQNGGGLLGLVGGLLTCLTNLIAQILGAVTSLPNTITNLVSGLQSQITGLEPNIKDCTSGIVVQLTSTASPVVNDLISCIQDAISSAGSSS